MKIDLNNFNLSKIAKLGHDIIVKIAQKMKAQNNKTVDRLYYKYADQLKELNIGFIRERVTTDLSDDRLLSIIDDAYNNLTIGGGGKLGAKALKEIDTFNRDITDVEPELYEALYNKFLSMGTDEQIQEVKFNIGSDEAYAENLFKGSRIERTNKFMDYLERTGKLDQAVLLNET